jgi:hypothetical protein
MNNQRAPMILAGQIFLSEELNEYLIVTKATRGQISYAGLGFKGHSEDQTFVERFKPVDPTDVDSVELASLLANCAAGTRASTGFISQD